MKPFVQSFMKRGMAQGEAVGIIPQVTPKQGGGGDGRPKSTGPPRPAELRAGFSSVTLAGSPSAVAFPRQGITNTDEPFWRV